MTLKGNFVWLLLILNFNCTEINFEKNYINFKKELNPPQIAILINSPIEPTNKKIEVSLDDSMPKIPKNVNLISSPNKFTLKKTKVYKNNRTSKVNFKSDFKLFAFVIFIIFSIYAVCILMKLEKTNKINEQNIFYSDQRRVKMYTKTPKQSIASSNTSYTNKTKISETKITWTE